MIDDLAKEEQQKIIDALELSVPDGIDLSIRYITFYSYDYDEHLSYYKIELDGIENYEAFFEANKEQRDTGKFVIDGYAQNIYSTGSGEYYLSIMVYQAILKMKRNIITI